MATTTSTSVSNTSREPWESAAWETLYNDSHTLAQQPYTAYGQPRIAGFSGDQLQAMQMGRDNVGVAQPLLGQAVNSAQGALATPTQAGIAQYMNPYDQLVSQSVIGEMRRQSQISSQGDAAQAARIGAMGGDRYAIQTAERDRNLQTAIADMLARQGAASYSQALDQYNKQQMVGLQGAGVMSNLAGNTQALNNQDVSALMGIGMLQQGQNQQALDLGYQDFQQQQQFPYNNLRFTHDILTGAPSQGTTSTSTTQPGQSNAAQWIGLGLAGAGIGLSAADAFGWF